MGFLVRQVVFTAEDDVTAAEHLDAGPLKGVTCDPGPVGLWSLEAMLMRRDFDDVLSEQGEPIAMVNEGQRIVLALNMQLRDRLAGLRGWRAQRVARRWARTDEVRAERLGSAAVSRLVFELSELARGAAGRGHGLYLWVDVDERALFADK